MEKNISHISGIAASRTGYRSNTGRNNTMAKSTYAQILSEIIAKQTEELQDAMQKGQTMQQKALGISDSEWARMDLQNSSLTKTDAEKELEEKNAQGTTLLGGDRACEIFSVNKSPMAIKQYFLSTSFLDSTALRFIPRSA